MNSMKQTLMPILLPFLLLGCQQDKSDLQAYVEQVKSQQKSDIPPIPVMKPYEKFDYDAASLRDPFVPTVKEVPETANNGSGIMPDTNRRTEALEFFELSDLQYVGTLEREEIWALIRSPDGVIHRTQVGNYMGKNYGKIMAIADNKIQLKEIVPSGSGFIERDTDVSVVEVN